MNQVFYVDDPVDSTWSVVLTSMTRDYHEVYNDDDLGDTVLENPPFCSKVPGFDVDVTAADDADTTCSNLRENGEGIWIKN